MRATGRGGPVATNSERRRASWPDFATSRSNSHRARGLPSARSRRRGRDRGQSAGATTGLDQSKSLAGRSTASSCTSPRTGPANRKVAAEGTAGRPASDRCVLHDPTFEAARARVDDDHVVAKSLHLPQAEWLDEKLEPRQPGVDRNHALPLRTDTWSPCLSNWDPDRSSTLLRAHRGIPERIVESRSRTATSVAKYVLQIKVVRTADRVSGVSIVGVAVPLAAVELLVCTPASLLHR